LTGSALPVLFLVKMSQRFSRGTVVISVWVFFALPGWLATLWGVLWLDCCAQPDIKAIKTIRYARKKVCMVLCSFCP